MTLAHRPPSTRPARDDTAAVHSVLVAIDLLDCFAQHDEMGVSEIARELGVSKSTAHRLLTTLCARRVAEQNPRTGQYRLGLHLFELGQLAQSRAPLRQAALPLLEDLRMATGQTAHLSVADGADVVFLERLQTLRSIPLLGSRDRRMPVHTTSAGKVLAAFDPVVASARAAAGLPALTDATVTSLAAWERLLEDVRRKGYAFSSGENRPGLASVAAPVRDSSGRARAAVSVAGPSAAFEGYVERIARAVIITANKLAHRLAW
jgi:IclR family transcriptional regulator, KDG regulon repressor